MIKEHQMILSRKYAKYTNVQWLVKVFICILNFLASSFLYFDRSPT